MNSKQRAFLRSQASGIEPVFQIGKDGVTPSVVSAVDAALNRRELVKLTVLPAADVTAKECLAVLAAALSAEEVCAIGGKVVLYRRSKTQTKHIELPR